MISIINNGYSQNSEDTRLALQYFQNKEYQKSAELYKKLHAQSGSNIHFDYLIKSYTALQDYQTAQKTIQKQIKKQKTNLSLYVTLGSVYEKASNLKEADETYKTAISKLTKSHTQTMQLAQAFNAARKFEYAEQTYLKAQKLGTDKYYEELAKTYMYMKKHDKMVDMYLELLAKDETKLSSVENNLQSALYYDIDKTIKKDLKTKLIKSLQSSPNKTVYNELLIWLFIQDNDYESAFFQASALDKRNKEDGNRLIKLARIAKTNKDYNSAIKCYEYIIAKNNSIYHNIANTELLKTLSEKLYTQSQITDEELTVLEAKYKETLETIGLSNKSIETALELSKLQATYLSKYEEAISLAKQCVSSARSKKKIALAQMTLADIYLISGDIWEANLLYAKIEKENPHNPTGFQAKFMKAQTAYFSGNFEWAQAMLDVLKASTSKLIANDAYELSQLIKDNTALDTSYAAMSIYAEAEYLLFRGKKDQAMAMLDSLKEKHPGHSLEDDIIYKKAEIYIAEGNFTKAAEALENIVEYYAYDIQGDNATFFLAEINEKQFKNNKKAMELYQKIISDYKNSIYLAEARKRFRLLQKESL